MVLFLFHVNSSFLHTQASGNSHVFPRRNSATGVVVSSRKSVVKYRIHGLSSRKLTIGNAIAWPRTGQAIRRNKCAPVLNSSLKATMKEKSASEDQPLPEEEARNGDDKEPTLEDGSLR